MAIHKVNPPTGWVPKLYVVPRPDRGQWTWKYTLPMSADVWMYRNVGESESRAKKDGEKKKAALIRGELDDRDFEKYCSHASGGLLTIEKACEQYIKVTSLEKTALTSYNEGCIVKQAFSFFKGKKEFVHEITPIDVWDFRTHLLTQVADGEIKKVSVKGIFNAFRRVLKWLKKTGRSTSNPAIEVDPIVVPKEEKSRGISFTEDQMWAIAQAQYSQGKRGILIKAIALFMYMTGLRLGEVLHIEWSDIDWIKKVLRLRNKPLCPTKRALGWKPKCGKERDVPLSDAAIALLEQLPRYESVGYVGKKAHPANFVFVVVDGKRMKKGSKEKAWKRIDCLRGSWQSLMESAGLWSKDLDGFTSDVRFQRHDLRRTFNHHSRKQGTTTSARSQVLGHGEDVNLQHYNGELKGAELDAELRKAVDVHPSNDLSLVRSLCSTGGARQNQAHDEQEAHVSAWGLEQKRLQLSL